MKLVLPKHIRIQAIMSDSRVSLEKSIFFCLKGHTNDAHDFVDAAIKHGAICIVHSKPLEKVDGIHYIKVSDVFEAYVQYAHDFYHHVSDKLTMVGVTGTNGKTTVATLFHHILSNLRPTGYIGTNGVSYGNKKLETTFTTPLLHDSLSFLNEMVNGGVKLCAIEASSEALNQGRVKGIDFDVAVFTNLTHEHMNYHKTFDHYLNAKKILFDKMAKTGYAVINSDDGHGFDMVKDTKAKVITYGIESKADYRAVNIELSEDGTRFDLMTPTQSVHIQTNLIAKFNVYNLLSVLATFDVLGFDLNSMIPFLNKIDDIEGRMKHYSYNDRRVIVDYAHTPDSFEKLFAFAQNIKRDGRIIAVFGSAGQRDIDKRAMLGKIASENSDIIILTEEDHRQESVRDISLAIKEGISEDTETYLIDDRFEAIKKGFDCSKPNDVLLILGKGSENFLDRSQGRESWLSDTSVVENYIKENS